MKKFSLNGEWSGKCYKDGKIQFDFDGTVPGCVHTDIAGKHIPKDLFYRNNADDCQWIENCDFTYTKTFIPEKSGSAKLVFEGLDVYCDIYLNNKKLGSCDNMFIPHSFDISNILKSGENMVEVRFFSPIKAVQDKPALSGAFTTERMHTRRIQCTYGWDWVARFVTMGIFRDVYLEYTGEFDADNIYVYTDTIEKDYAQIVIEAEFKNCENGGFAEIEILSPDGKTVYNEKRYVKENI